MTVLLYNRRSTRTVIVTANTTFSVAYGATANTIPNAPAIPHASATVGVPNSATGGAAHDAMGSAAGNATTNAAFSVTFSITASMTSNMSYSMPSRVFV
jgi:hypothetical protein